jgi:hypothetical protein
MIKHVATPMRTNISSVIPVYASTSSLTKFQGNVLVALQLCYSILQKLYFETR